MVFRLPLSVVLGLQVVVVAAAFTAVILVLSEQQRTEFQSSLYQQLSLRQSNVMKSVTGPLLSRIEAFDFAISSYTAGVGGSGRFPAPSDDPTTSDLESSLPFYNHFYIYPYTDPSFLIITLSNQSRRIFAPYINTSRPTTWNIWVVDTQKLVSIGENEKANVCFKSFPIRSPVTSSCMFIIPLDYNTATAVGSEYELIPSRRMLSIATLIEDPTVASGMSHVVTFTVNFPWKPQVITSAKDLEDHFLLFSASISVKHIKPLVLAQTTLPSSTSAVFTYRYRVEDGTEDYYFLTGRVDFPDFDTKVLNETKSSTDAAWRGGRSPDAVLNKVFLKAVGMLVNQTGSTVFEVSDDGKRYVAAVGRVYEPNYNMNWLLLEYTPREDFFRSSDRARAAGIIIGTVGGIAVLVVCLLVWLAVQLPLRQLSGTMSLAADMRNDEVIYNEPILSEIGVLNDAFRDMNNKLLAARPFLPQSLLRAGGSSGDDDDEEDGGESGGDDIDVDTESDTQMLESVKDQDTLSFSTAYSSHTRAAGGRRTVGGGSPLAKMGGRGRSSKKTLRDNEDGCSTVAGSVSHHGNPHRAINHRQLSYRRVSVLSINVLGFGDAVPSPSEVMTSGRVGRLSHLHAALTKLIEATVGEERGIVDYFHGDRFVCGFNTARVCGNSTRNGAECAAKIWDRFLEYSTPIEPGANAAGRANRSYPGDDLFTAKDHTAANNNNNNNNNNHTTRNFLNIDGRRNELLTAFPCGLAMGLGVGRSLVGNHGTDTMQRLATIGGAYTEATRLQDVMSRKILLTTRGGRHSSAADLPPLFPAGRCLVMGRVIDDLEASSVYCQILGGVDAGELLGAKASMDESKVSAFVRGKNRSSLLRSAAGMGCVAALAAAPHSSTSAGRRMRSVLVAAVVSSESIRKALEDEMALGNSSTMILGGGGGGAATTKIGRSQHQQQEEHVLDHQMVVRTFDDSSPAVSGPPSFLMTRAQEASVSPLAGFKRSDSSPLWAKHSVAHNSPNTTPIQVEAGAGKVKQMTSGGADTAGDEWLYELENDKSRNPFGLANLALYRLWNSSTSTGGGGDAPHAAVDVTVGAGICDGSAVVPPSLAALVRAVERRSVTKQTALPPSLALPRDTSGELSVALLPLTPPPPPAHTRGLSVVELGKSAVGVGGSVLGMVTTDASEGEHVPLSLPDCFVPNPHNEMTANNANTASNIRWMRTQLDEDGGDARPSRVVRQASQAPQWPAHMLTSAPVSCRSIAKWLYFLSCLLTSPPPTHRSSAPIAGHLPNNNSRKDAEASATDVIIDALTY